MKYGLGAGIHRLVTEAAFPCRPWAIRRLSSPPSHGPIVRGTRAAVFSFSAVIFLGASSFVGRVESSAADEARRTGRGSAVGLACGSTHPAMVGPVKRGVASGFRNASSAPWNGMHWPISTTAAAFSNPIIYVY